MGEDNEIAKALRNLSLTFGEGPFERIAHELKRIADNLEEVACAICTHSSSVEEGLEEIADIMKMKLKRREAAE